MARTSDVRPSEALPCLLRLQGFITEVREEMGMAPNKPGIRIVSDADKSCEGRPQPPYLSTVNNLGLSKMPGMPNLLVRCLFGARGAAGLKWCLKL